MVLARLPGSLLFPFPFPHSAKRAGGEAALHHHEPELPGRHPPQLPGEKTKKNFKQSWHALTYT